MARRGRPPYDDILTPREWEVLGLLRERLSNPEIADRLRISRETVKFHVSEILSKLGISSREEAARWQPEHRPWWASALAPVAFLWRRPSFGWLAPVSASLVAVGLAVGAGLLVWALVRTDAGGDGAAVLQGPTPGPTATQPQSPEHLVWESEDTNVESVYPGTCGDAATADAHGVPMMLRIPRGGLLGLEPEPYEYVAAQVNPFGPYDRSPEGWELDRRVVAGLLVGNGPSQNPDEPPWPDRQELFLRRLDQPTLLFRYAAGYCDQNDGSPAVPIPGSPLGDTRIELPLDPPQVVEYRDGNYLSASEAMDVAENRFPGMRPVRAELGTAADLTSELGDGSIVFDPRGDVVRWAILLAAGDQMGPKRAGTEYGAIVQLDATTGDVMSWGCCFSLVSGS